MDVPLPDDGTYEGPLLLGGMSANASLESVLAAMPPKHVVDRLLSKYLTARDPAHGD